MKADTNISSWVRGLRTRCGLTQEQFAAKLGVTFPTINRWENERSCPSPLALLQLQNLARELGPAPEEARSIAAGKEPAP